MAEILDSSNLLKRTKLDEMHTGSQPKDITETKTVFKNNVKKLRKLLKEEAEETVQETVNFVIDENKSTSNSKFIIRKRKVVHKVNNQTFVELYEDTFTIPLHKFNLNLILSQTKIQNIQETVIIERNIQRMNQKENIVEIEELTLPTDSVNFETVLPIIDHTEICNILIKEERKQIVKKKKIERKKKKEIEDVDIPDLETVPYEEL